MFLWEGHITDPMPSSRTHDQLPAEMGKEVAKVPGKVRGGVAFARWKPPADFDPFAHSSWLVDHDLELEVFDKDDATSPEVSSDDLITARGASPPVFLIEAGNEWAFSLPPRQDLDELRIVQESDGPGIAIGYDFGIVPWEASGGRAKPSLGMPGDVGILALLMNTREVTPEPPDPEVSEA